MRQYKPFGKPGAGAPIYKHDHKRHKFTEYHTQNGVSVQQEMAGDYEVVFQLLAQIFIFRYLSTR